MNIVDAQHIDVIQSNIQYPNTLCLDFDEQDDMLHLCFKNKCEKAIMLNPPPVAMHAYIDGNYQEFVDIYNYHLDNNEAAQMMISQIIYGLFTGINYLLYVPCFLEDDSIWINTFMMYFYTRFGITIGTSENSPFMYDQSRELDIANFLYLKKWINAIDYINCTGYNQPDPRISDKLYSDLSQMYPSNNPIDVYNQLVYNIRSRMNQNGVWMPC